MASPRPPAPAKAAAGIARHIGRISADMLPDTTSRMADSFDRSNDELEALRHEMRPMIRQIDNTSDSIASLETEVSEVAEPLPAAERIGRIAERLPGKTKPDQRPTSCG
jgi:methyl-accepting chemotaxis protein